jgi:hypothetical protein
MNMTGGFNQTNTHSYHSTAEQNMDAGMQYMMHPAAIKEEHIAQQA